MSEVVYVGSRYSTNGRHVSESGAIWAQVWRHTVFASVHDHQHELLYADFTDNQMIY